REFKPHLVNAHFLPTYGLAAVLARVHPFVLTLWGSDILVSGRKGILSRLRSRYVLEKADLVVGDAEYLVAEAARLTPLRRQLVVSFGVSESWYESGRARELKSTEVVRIISTRQLEKIYDHTTLIRAARLLADEGFAFRLTLIGSGSRETELKTLAAQLKLTDNINFTGRFSEEELLTAYRRADIYVSTAKSDATSVSLLEAMSQKLYPVVTDIPGNREWLDSDRHFFEPGNARQLADKIKLGHRRDARVAAYDLYEPRLRQRGIREEQMKVAHLAFTRLIEDYHAA
ncbi:MAG: glycosyltransferase, partial [candidate division Zixibacteria bacterium]|nr:glycosyltransferase [candidate division Zixibacteria bacterium]